MKNGIVGYLYLTPLVLLFLPSVTFGLLSAEVFPWAIILFLLYYNINIRINKRLVWYFSILFLLSIYALYLNTSLYDVARSFSAFINPILAFELIMLLKDKFVLKICRVTKNTFLFFIIVGIGQYLGLLSGFDAFFKFLAPRASAESLAHIGRGVTIFSSEPARAGVEIIFLYLFVRTVFVNKKYLYLTDGFIVLFLVIVVQSAMTLFLFFAFIAIYYRSKMVVIFAFFIMILPFIDPNIYSGRAVKLLVDVVGQASYSESLFLLVNTSGHRLISIVSSYMYGFYSPIGGGVGNWMEASIFALDLTGFDLSTLNYFNQRADGYAVGIRASGYVSNLMVEGGLVSTIAFFYYIVKRCSPVQGKHKEIMLVFLIKILFVGSVGTPVAFICIALLVRYDSFKNKFKVNGS